MTLPPTAVPGLPPDQAMAGVVLALVGGIEAATLARSVTATVGFFVAYQAYRGYRRNDSRPMLFLGIGIFFVTTVSFVVPTFVARPLGASGGVAILAFTVLNVLGLTAIFYALTGAGRTDGAGEPTGTDADADPGEEVRR